MDTPPVASTALNRSSRFVFIAIDDYGHRANIVSIIETLIMSMIVQPHIFGLDIC